MQPTTAILAFVIPICTAGCANKIDHVNPHAAQDDQWVKIDIGTLMANDPDMVIVLKGEYDEPLSGERSIHLYAGAYETLVTEDGRRIWRMSTPSSYRRITIEPDGRVSVQKDRSPFSTLIGIIAVAKRDDLAGEKRRGESDGDMMLRLASVQYNKNLLTFTPSPKNAAGALDVRIVHW